MDVQRNQRVSDARLAGVTGRLPTAEYTQTKLNRGRRRAGVCQGSTPWVGARNVGLGGEMTAPATVAGMMRAGLPQPEASDRGAEAMPAIRTVQAGRASRVYLGVG